VPGKKLRFQVAISAETALGSHLAGHVDKSELLVELATLGLLVSPMGVQVTHHTHLQNQIGIPLPSEAPAVTRAPQVIKPVKVPPVAKEKHLLADFSLEELEREIGSVGMTPRH